MKTFLVAAPLIFISMVGHAAALEPTRPDFAAREPAAKKAAEVKAAAPAQKGAATPATQMLEDFESGYQWSDPQKKDGKVDYALAHEGKNTFLHATYLAGTTAKLVYRKIRWDTERYPFLKWRWRIDAFTKGARIMDPPVSDAPAQIYVTWRIRGRAFALKYVWAESEPVGSTFMSGKWNPFGTYQGILVESGGAPNQWRTTVRNLRKDFLGAFGHEAPAEAVGLAVLTDGDETGSLPVADYDDFEARTSE